MKRVRHYMPEIALIAGVIAISVLGFWNIYFGADADPQPHHHLHLATTFTWMGLLLAQLILIVRRSYHLHRTIGLAVLLAGPLLVATTALLAVRSAHQGMVSGEGDFMIIQNSVTTLVLGVLIFLAFLLKNRRKLHASLLLSTTILFIGIALFFALTSFAPGFRIDGAAFGPEDPDMLYRFQLAGTAGQVTCLAVGLLFFLRDPRNGWPLLATAFTFPLNNVIFALLAGSGLIGPLTGLVGSMSQPLTFVTVFVLLFALLLATALPRRRPTPADPVTAAASPAA